MIVEAPDGRMHLREILADNEAEMQEKLRRYPELLPLDELGLEGPLLIVGRETSLPSGAVDLVGMARSGAILVIEFKTGPQNSDFRHALAQVVDYGSHLWEMDPQDFETTVAQRYFASEHGSDASGRADSISEAAKATWPQLTPEELASFNDGWREVLASGGFHFVLVAQRFTPTITRTMHYLNQISQPARFCAVELVRFISMATKRSTPFELGTQIESAHCRRRTRHWHRRRSPVIDTGEVPVIGEHVPFRVEVR
jgi:hypothetical protein